MKKKKEKKVQENHLGQIKLNKYLASYIGN